MLQAAKDAIVHTLCTERVGTAVQRVTHGHVRSRRAVFDVSGWEPHLAAAVAFRLYERAEARFALKYLAGSERVLELGGSRGVVSSMLMQRLPEQAELVSVEGNPRLVRDLTSNLAGNAHGRKATGRHLAVSDGSMVRFESRGSLGSSLSTSSGEPVPTTTLQDLVESLGWDDFAMLSDIEGAEAMFIMGEDRGLERCDRLVIELHDTRLGDDAVSVSDMLEALVRRHGFTPVDRHRNVVVLVRAGA
jgi:FkbM family methyltransferase